MDREGASSRMHTPAATSCGETFQTVVLARVRTTSSLGALYFYHSIGTSSKIAFESGAPRRQ
jgi:hypothetical protein